MNEFENENEADWGEPTETTATQVGASDNLKTGTSPTDEAEIIEVDGTVTANWKGQSGCCEQSRVDAEWAAAIQSWVDQQKAAHPTLTYITVGWGNATGECRKWDNWPNGRRCNGSLSGPATAYFRSAT